MSSDVDSMIRCSYSKDLKTHVFKSPTLCNQTLLAPLQANDLLQIKQFASNLRLNAASSKLICLSLRPQAACHHGQTPRCIRAGDIKPSCCCKRLLHCQLIPSLPMKICLHQPMLDALHTLVHGDPTFAITHDCAVPAGVERVRQELCRLPRTTNASGGLVGVLL